MVPLEVPMPTEAAEQGGADSRAAPTLRVPWVCAGVFGDCGGAMRCRKCEASPFGSGEMEHPVSDLPYGQVDADMFLDVAIGRIVSATIEEGGASHWLWQYEQLADGFWDAIC